MSEILIPQESSKRRGKVYSAVNQKGGVGKTTCVINTGAGLAKHGKKVLLVDFDHQANLTKALFPRIFEENKEKRAEEEISIFRVLQKRMDDILAQKSKVTDLAKRREAPCYLQDIKNVLLTYQRPDFSLDVLPSSSRLTNFELYSQKFSNPRLFLKQILSQIKHQYDYILIDSPPSLGSLTINALVASDSVIIPVSDGAFPLEGIEILLEAIEEINDAFSTNITVCGFVMSLNFPREVLARESERVLRSTFGEKVFKTKIRRNVSLNESQGIDSFLEREPDDLDTNQNLLIGGDIFTYAPHSTGAEDYLNFTKELLNREEN